MLPIVLYTTSNQLPLQTGHCLGEDNLLIMQVVGVVVRLGQVAREAKELEEEQAMEVNMCQEGLGHGRS